MFKTLKYGYNAFQLSWRANGFAAILVIVGKIYDSTAYPFIQIFLLARVLDMFAATEDVRMDDLMWIIVSYIIASLFKLWLKSYLDIKETYLQTEIEGYLDIQINRKLTELDPATFENPEFQDLLSQLEGIKGTLQMHLIRFTGLVDAVFKFATATIVVSITFPWFPIIILLATIPSYLAWDKARNATWPFFVEKRSRMIRVTQYVKNLLSADSTSKEASIFNTGDEMIGKIKKEQDIYYQDFNKTNNPFIYYVLITRLLQFSAFVYTQYLNLSKVLGGTLGIGQFSLVFQQSLNLTLSAEEILNQYSSIGARNKYVDKYFEFLNIKCAIVSPANPKEIPADPNPVQIEFRNVSFKYPKSDRYILKDFNVTIKPGEKIALVGENGAGKTTIIKLLLRFYDVSEGEILANGINIKDVDLVKWHKYIGALFQDFIKYQFTFKENVYLGNLEEVNNEELLKDAITRSGADKYLSNLPKGIENVVGKMFEGGVDLSGGQWQKLALARAFFRNAPLLILDEPTSAIDAKAEFEIFQNVQNLQKDKTVIIISHRFSTVRNADRILVLDQGRIIEEGDHQSLMLKKGLYAELFEIQAQGYK